MIHEKLLVKIEPTNPRDKNAVAIYKNNDLVGHMPYNLAPYLSGFLVRDVNKAFAEVTGERVNRKAGYGHVCTDFINKAYVDRMKEITDSMVSSGLI